MREILCREKILKFGPMRRSIRIADRWQKDFRRILVIEFVSEHRDIQRQGPIGEARRASEPDRHALPRITPNKMYRP